MNWQRPIINNDNTSYSGLDPSDETVGGVRVLFRGAWFTHCEKCGGYATKAGKFPEVDGDSRSGREAWECQSCKHKTGWPKGEIPVHSYRSGYITVWDEEEVA